MLPIPKKCMELSGRPNTNASLRTGATDHQMTMTNMVQVVVVRRDLTMHTSSVRLVKAETVLDMDVKHLTALALLPALQTIHPVYRTKFSQMKLCDE